MRFAPLFLLSLSAIAGEYTTYIGDQYPRYVTAITTDAVGNTYITGNRGIGGGYAFTYAVTGGIGLPPVSVNSPFFYVSSPNDIFISKLDTSGKILFTDTFAGKGLDQALAVAVDRSGNIYVAGATTSNDFPLSNALQAQIGLYGTGFIIKLSPDGKTILYSTYFGGLNGTTITAMATDANGNLYLTGQTVAPDFPHTTGMPAGSVRAQGPSATSAAFVTAISAAGDKILFSGTISGTAVSCGSGSFCLLSQRNTAGVGISLDPSSNVYIVGNSNTTDLPTTTGVLAKQGIGAFVAKIKGDGSGIAYLTYLGSANYVAAPFATPGNTLRAIAVDSLGNAYLAGATSDPQFPATAGSLQSTFAGTVTNPDAPPPPDAFLAKLKPDGSAMVWATFLGGPQADAANSIAVDPSGNVWAVGTTASSTFPNAQGWSQGGDFLVQLNSSGSALNYSARYPGGSASQVVAFDSAYGFIHTSGSGGIVSTIVPGQAPAMKVFGITNAAGGSIAGRVAAAEVISIYGPHIGPSAPVTATPIGGFYPTVLGGVQVTIGGIAAPLLYVSDSQINAVVPMGISQASPMQIVNGSITSAAFPMQIDPSDPGIFAGVLNQDGSLNSQTNPAKAGSAVTFYATGWQAGFYSLKDGQVATQAVNSCANCTVIAGIQIAQILYIGPAPGIVAGVIQVNVQLPAPNLENANPLTISLGYPSITTTLIWVK